MNNLSKIASPYFSLQNIERLLKIDRLTLRKIAKHSGSYYNPYDKQEIKPDGTKKWRHIANPDHELKKVQVMIYSVILKKHMLLLPEGIMGGISGKSIKDNAYQHLKQELVVTIDIKDCFPKTTNKMVFKAWRETIGCSEKVAGLLTQLTTFQRQLPQGAPTSSALCNLCLLPMFTEIKKYTDENNIAFTLYVDDITLSGNTVDVKASLSFVIATIKKYGFSVSNKKILKMPANVPQKVTGILVNNKVSIAHNKTENIRTTIMQLARRKSTVTIQEYNSIIGKIKYVKKFSEEKGIKLEEFAAMFLQKTGLVSGDKQKFVTRKCRHHKSLTLI